MSFQISRPVSYWNDFIHWSIVCWGLWRQELTACLQSAFGLARELRIVSKARMATSMCVCASVHPRRQELNAEGGKRPVHPWEGGEERGISDCLVLMCRVKTAAQVWTPAAILQPGADAGGLSCKDGFLGNKLTEARQSLCITFRYAIVMHSVSSSLLSACWGAPISTDREWEGPGNGPIKGISASACFGFLSLLGKCSSFSLSIRVIFFFFLLLQGWPLSSLPRTAPAWKERPNVLQAIWGGWLAPVSPWFRGAGNGVRCCWGLVDLLPWLTQACLSILAHLHGPEPGGHPWPLWWDWPAFSSLPLALMAEEDLRVLFF